MAGLVVAGLALRLWVLLGRLGTLDSDEAVVGLLAHRLAQGHGQAFYWAQHYAGTLEPGLVAAVIAATGLSVVAVKAVPLALSAVMAVLVWRLGRHFLVERAAQAAGVLCWVAPASYVWWATKERGFYWVSICLGIGLLLAAVHAADRPHRWWPWAALGLLAGAGFWTSPTVVYFALPAAGWLLAGKRVDWSRAPAAIPGFLLGSLPWLVHNLGHGWPSLDRPSQPQHVGYLGGMGRFLWRVLPIALDLRVPISERWQVPVLAPLALVGAAAAVVVAVVRRADRPLLVLAGLVAFPFLYALFPVAWFVGEGRYGLFALPFLALTLAWVVRRPALLLALAGVALALTMSGLHHLGTERPRHIGTDIAALRAAGVDRVWADYWIAYRLTYESHLHITATSARSARYRPYVDRALADTTPAYAYGRRDGRARRLAAILGARHLPFRTVRTPHLEVLLIGGPLVPDELPEDLRP